MVSISGKNCLFCTEESFTNLPIYRGAMRARPFSSPLHWSETNGAISPACRLRISARRPNWQLTELSWREVYEGAASFRKTRGSRTPDEATSYFEFDTWSERNSHACPNTSSARVYLEPAPWPCSDSVVVTMRDATSDAPVPSVPVAIPHV